MKRTNPSIQCALLLLACPIGFFLSGPALAQPKPTASVELESLRFTDPKDPKKTLPYRFLTPGRIEKDKRYPVMICLHGRGADGDNNTGQDAPFQPLFSGKAREIGCADREEIHAKHAFEAASPCTYS